MWYGEVFFQWCNEFMILFSDADILYNMVSTSIGTFTVYHLCTHQKLYIFLLHRFTANQSISVRDYLTINRFFLGKSLPSLITF